MKNEYFKTGGDLNDAIKPVSTEEQETYIQNYLLEIVSGES